jgi:hypothetical protein
MDIWSLHLLSTLWLCTYIPKSAGCYFLRACDSCIYSALNEYLQVQYSSSGTMIVLHKAKWGKYSPRSRTGLCSVAKNCCTNLFVWKGAVGDAKIHLCDLRFWWHWLWIILSSEIWHCFVWQTGIHVCFRGRFRLYP